MSKKSLFILSVFTITILLALAIFYYANELRINFNNKYPDSYSLPTDKNAGLELKPKSVIVPEKFKGLGFEGKVLNVPEKYSVSLFAANLKGPRFFDFDNSGNIFLAEMNSGKILLIKSNGQDFADEILTVDSGLKTISSVSYYKGDLYSAEEDKIVVYKNIDDKGKYSEKKTLVANLPTGGHVTRTVKIGPDQKMYVSIGSSCNICDEKDPRRAAVVRYNLDGTGEEIFSSGLRNSVGILFRENLLWSVDNGRDLIGDDLPPEEVNVLNLGKNYGWPYCYGRKFANPEYPLKSQYCTDQTESPTYQIQAHSAPLGLDFLDDNLYIALHGSWNRSIPTGYKIIIIDTSSVGNPPHDFITGWLQDNGKPWGRPVGVKFDSQGRLFISDDFSGAIYMIF